MKLFAVLLGGRAEGCNTELHDVVFAVGNSIEDTYPQLKNKWFGNQKRLHIDSFIELTLVDGHEITITDTKPADNNKKLFFANFGGYKSGYFGEIHEVNFYAAASKPEVLGKARQELGLSLIEPHCDDNVLVDDIIEVGDLGQYYISLTPSTERSDLVVNSGYRRLV